MGISFWKSKNKAQASIYLIGVIAVIIIAIIATVTLGKKKIVKVYTANAADAGAISGASILANGLNAIGDISTIMYADFLAMQVLIGSCALPCGYAHSLLYATAAANSAQFLYAGRVGREACVEAKETAEKLAEVNCGATDKIPCSVEVDGPADFTLVSLPQPYWMLCWVPCGYSYCCVLYEVGVFIFAGISDAINDDDHITVTATRSDNSETDGVNDLINCGTIASHGEGQAHEGNVLPMGEYYDSKLVEPSW